jgi:hypothetical protein
MPAPIDNITRLAEYQRRGGRREGIATTYNGIRYRSRLEAKWAAFFELLGWRAFYEPFDLDGYIPDFVLHSRNGNRTLVEVKPVASISDPLFREAKAKIDQSGWKHDALIVTYFLLEYEDLLCPGWHGEFCSWGPPAPLDFSAFRWDLKPFRNECDYAYKQLIKKRWHEAGNAVQWRPS